MDSWNSPKANRKKYIKVAGKWRSVPALKHTGVPYPGISKLPLRLEDHLPLGCGIAARRRRTLTRNGGYATPQWQNIPLQFPAPKQMRRRSGPVA
jgi:hypothetical protein